MKRRFSKSKFSFTCFLAINLILISHSQSAQSQTGELTLGAVLAKLLGDVNSTIQGAVGGVLSIEVQAGGQIAGLIQQAQVAYAADLNLTFDKISATEKQTINDISSITQEFTRNTAASAASVMSKSQQIANTLPLAGLFPQVTAYSPAYVLPDHTPHANDVTVTVEGNFADVFRNNSEAVVLIAGKRFLDVEKTTQRISFRIPASTLKQPVASEIGFNELNVEIPYQTSSVLGQGHRELASFKLLIGSLPNIVGELFRDTSTSAPTLIKKQFVTGEIQQESGDDDIKCGGEHGDLAIHTVQADPGWTIIPSTVTPIITWSQGTQGPDQDWWIESNCSNQTTACLCVSTEHHRFGTSGKVHFTMKYIAQQPGTEKSGGEIGGPLSWGYRGVWDAKGVSSWKLILTRFDGRRIEISGPYSDEFIRVTTSGSQVTIQSYPFS